MAHQPQGEVAQAPMREMLALADRRLYTAKQGGRNRVVDAG